ncbi:unnamed protein product [Amoebophrya sp. A120]|nr:unnamed protein product [Amoebophrya sp. A120]|eukprot:GSA120T00023328001.1
MESSFLNNVYILSPKPSFFELSQAEQIGHGLHAALQHVVRVLRDRWVLWAVESGVDDVWEESTSSYSKFFGWLLSKLVQRPQLAETIGSGVLEAWFLSRRSSFFGEHFWGLQMELAPLQVGSTRSSTSHRPSFQDLGGTSWKQIAKNAVASLQQKIEGAQDRCCRFVHPADADLFEARQRERHTISARWSPLDAVELEKRRQRFTLSARARVLFVFLQVVWPVLEARCRQVVDHWKREFREDFAQLEQSLRRFLLERRAAKATSTRDDKLQVDALEKAWEEAVGPQPSTTAELRGDEPPQGVPAGQHQPRSPSLVAGTQPGARTLTPAEDHSAGRDRSLIEVVPEGVSSSREQTYYPLLRPENLRIILRYSLYRLLQSSLFICRAVQLLFRFGYLFQRCESWSFFLWLFRLQMVRKQFAAAEQLRLQTENAAKLLDATERTAATVVGQDNKGADGRNRNYSEALRQTLFDKLQATPQALFWAGLYGLQFYQWFGSRAEELQPAAEAEIPPPPKPPARLKIPIYQDPRICSLCRKGRKNPAHSVSGFIFCYKCLAEFVGRKGFCPATHRPMEIADIRQMKLAQ